MFLKKSNHHFFLPMKPINDNSIYLLYFIPFQIVYENNVNAIYATSFMGHTKKKQSANTRHQSGHLMRNFMLPLTSISIQLKKLTAPYTYSHKERKAQSNKKNLTPMIDNQRFFEEDTFSYLTKKAMKGT